MATYKKSDMVYDDYSWKAMDHDNPKITGKPDSTLFNRHEGYEVLYLINHLLKEKELTSVRSGNKMETLIREELPGNIRSQENVKEWINDNW